MPYNKQMYTALSQFSSEELTYLAPFIATGDISKLDIDGTNNGWWKDKLHLTKKATLTSADIIPQGDGTTTSEKSQNSVEGLRQLVAKQSVLKNLSKLSTTELDELVLYLDNGQYRQYLANHSHLKTTFGVDFIIAQGWNSNTANILTDEAIDEIRVKGVNAYVLRKAQMCQNLNLLNTVLLSQNDNDLSTALNNIGMPNGVVSNKVPFAKIDKTPIRQQAFLLWQQTQPIPTLAVLNATPLDKTSLPQEYKDLDEAWLRGAMGVVYLKAELNKDSKRNNLDFLAALSNGRDNPQHLAALFKDEQYKTFIQAAVKHETVRNLCIEASHRYLERLVETSELTVDDLMAIVALEKDDLSVSVGGKAYDIVPERLNQLQQLAIEKREALFFSAEGVDYTSLINNPSFDNEYKILLWNAQNPSVIQAYLAKNDVIDNIRKKAFLGFVQEKLKTEVNFNLNNLALDGSTGLDILLNNVNLTPQDLVNEVNIQSNIKALASSWQVIREDKIKTLETLVKPLGLDGFKKELSNLSRLPINELSIIDKKIQKEMQNEACDRLIYQRLNTETLLGMPAQRHLFNVMGFLSLEEKQKALAKKDLIPQLKKAIVGDNLEQAVSLLLGVSANKLDAIDKDALREEQKKAVLLGELHNVEMARVLMQMPNLILTKESINNLNTVVDSHHHIGGNDDYIALINAIATSLGNATDAFFYEKFGLDYDVNTCVISAGVNISEFKPVGIIHNSNIVINAVNTATPQQKTLLTYLLTLGKATTGTKISSHDVTRILLLVNVKNQEEMASILNKTPALIESLNKIPNWQLHLTPAVLTQLRHDTTKSKLSKENAQGKSDLGRVRCESILSDDKSAIDTLIKNINTFKKTTSTDFKKFENFSKISSFEWFNPAFQASALKQVEKYEEYKKLAENCDVIVENLKHKKAELEGYLSSLPSDLLSNKGFNTKYNEDAAKLMGLRLNELGRALDEVNKQLSVYKGAQTKLKGDPDNKDEMLREGMLSAIERARSAKPEDKKAIRLGNFNCEWKDYDLSVLDTHALEGYHKSVDKSHAQMKNRGPQDSTIIYQAHLGVDDPLDKKRTLQFIEPIPRGKGREYVKLPNAAFDTTGLTEVKKEEKICALTGIYIEKHGEGRVVSDGNGVKTKPGSVSLTSLKFPEAHPNVTPAELANARIEYALAMASQFLVSAPYKPSKVHPIVLVGADETELKYLWTACMILGKKDPNMVFDQNSIKVFSRNSSHDNQPKTRIPGTKGEFAYSLDAEIIKKELNWKDFTSDSLFHTEFMKHPDMAELLKGTQEVNKIKFQKTPDKDAVDSIAKTKLSKLDMQSMKKDKKLSDLMTSMQDENTAKGPAPTK